MIDQQQDREQREKSRGRSAEIAAFVAGLVATFAFFAFFPGLPHVIDWGAIVVSVLVGALARWGCRRWMERGGSGDTGSPRS
ncbi:hypothetical protein [Streptomyces ortus]|jgi:hypothetical protein|uniref:Uncharacterized protein n=1 Tax=Streptomyces ortus TaxID=2867268 RepID=A0ABT3V7F0_9ACTN|nr:hypothetical protein [Streptomyces ortus]MCX4235547.1 hypothetical protein [Streptomyces ortus]